MLRGDWSQEIRRDYTGGEVRFDFPVRPLGWGRLLGLFFVGFGVLFGWMPGHTAWEFIQKLMHGNRDVGTFIFSIFPLLFVVVGCTPIGIGLAVLFGRSRVEWRDGQLLATELVGPLRWKRRLPRKPVRKFEISAAASSSGSASPKAIPNFSGITLRYEDGSRKVLVLGYPREWLLGVAEELKSYVGSGSPSSQPVEVEVVEGLDEPEKEDDSILQPPPGTRVELQERGSEVHLVVPPAGIWKGSKGLFFFSLLWCGFMCVFTALPVFSHVKRGSNLPLAFWLSIPAFWMVGLGLMAFALNLGRRQAELSADSSRLHIRTSGLFGVKERDWARSDIAAVRADASGMEVNERPVIELQIHPVTGKKAGFLAGRNETELRWMAAHLRRALQVPARNGEKGPRFGVKGSVR